MNMAAQRPKGRFWESEGRLASAQPPLAPAAKWKKEVDHGF
jgi:hypothetical protein